MKIQVNSEIGKLTKVLVHRPGKEVERIYPEIFERILFDDIMDVEVAQEEHDYFTEQLKKEGIEVVYIENLVAETIKGNASLKEEFLNEFLDQANITNPSLHKACFDFFIKIADDLEFVRATIAGIMKIEITPAWDNSIDSHVLQHDDYPFYIDPIPNILFQRDPIASVYDSFNLHEMNKETRRRERIYYKYVTKHHPDWKDVKSDLTLGHPGTMEGGDVLVMNDETIFIGVSERTSAHAVEEFAKTFLTKHENLKRVIGIEIPRSHATMHLDTVFTQMDVDKFSIDADLATTEFISYEITADGNDIKIVANPGTKMIDVVKKYVHPDPIFAVVADGQPVAAKAEQWSDGANCLCIAPGTIVVYNRNRHTNKKLKSIGINLIEIKSGELSRGRGGPRCMTMPLHREAVK